MKQTALSSLRVQFWGTRGSLAKPGKNTLKYGGNTACVQVSSSSGTLIVIDCGTGIHDLGIALMGGKKPINGSILISHTHWDHIQGLPFFAPLFIPGNTWDIYAPHGLGQSLRETLAGQMQYTYFPVSLEQLGAKIHYKELLEGVFYIGDIKVTTQYLNHPALTLGYRLECGGATVVYISDHEPFSKPASDPNPEFCPRDRHHIEFLKGADLVIHDSQYTAAEYPQKVGWGHSTMEYSMNVCQAAGVHRLAFTHHDPLRDDATLDRLVEEMRMSRKAVCPEMEVFAAADRMVVELKGNSSHLQETTTKEPSCIVNESENSAEHTVLLAVSDTSLADSLASAARTHGVKVLQATDGKTALELARKHLPSLVIAEESLPVIDGLTLCHSLRSADSSDMKTMPVVILTREQNRTLETSTGITDWLLTPFSSTFIRTHIQAWIVRTPCRWKRAQKPNDEAQRLASLRALDLLDTAPQERFDRITRIAKKLADVPIAYISFVDENRQWFMSCHGLADKETPRDMALCAHVVVLRIPMIIPDTLQDARFADNPLVTGSSRVRFYAGFPLILPDCSCIGTLCFVDNKPRHFTDESLSAFADLAELVKQELIAGNKPQLLRS